MSFYRRVIRIKAEDSPNVKLGLAEVAVGRAPSDTVLIPGVLTYREYLKRRATWDRVRQCVGLDADFWMGGEVLLYPPDWLNVAAESGRVQRCRSYPAEAIGIDPAEGGDKTSMAAVNRYGLKDLVSRRTSNTAEITGEALAFMRKHNVPPDRVVFDRGGGGKQHADRLKAQGFPVRTVAFGEAPSLEIKRGLHQIETRRELQVERYVYVNLRAEMFHELSLLLDPTSPEFGEGFAIPDDIPPYTDLRSQLCVMPKLVDGEGRYWMLPKNKKSETDTRKTLIELIGHSPDEADSVVLAVHAMKHKRRVVTAGGF